MKKNCGQKSGYIWKSLELTLKYGFFSDPKLLKEADRQYLMENLGAIKKVIHSLGMEPEDKGESPLMTNANIETRKIHHSKGCMCKEKPGSKTFCDGLFQHSCVEGR